MVVVRKNGSIRLCVDLREANKAIIVDRFPLPHSDDLVHQLAGATHFSKINLASAYHQVELTTESRDLMTFIIHDGLFRFRRVCFGLASPPAAFQKMMTSILRGCRGVLCYIDDIVYGKTAAEHNANVHDVLQRISVAGLRLNDKCLFNVQELTFLGHVVSHNGLSPLKSKVEAVVHAPAPTNITELRSFLGLVSYYAKFMPHFADVVEPLRQLLGQGAFFSWDDKAAQSFRAVKQLLATCKAVQNPSLLPVVTTDASDYSMGAVLQQRYGNDLRTVAFASPTLLQAERKYSVGEKEALTCIWACEHWHVFLWGTKFELQTDHQALVTLLLSRGAGR